MTALAISVAVFLSLAMAGGWALAQSTGRSGYIDSVWSAATGAACAMAALGADGDPARRYLVAGMGALWGARLAFYLWRRASHGPDDARYAALKAEWGDKAGRQLFVFLQIQAAAALPLALASYFAAHAPRGGLGLQDILGQDVLGITIFVAALAGETIADRQMAAFKADPANKGKVCDTGLWAWSRHPNYFFEWMGWLAYPAIALSLAQPASLLSFGAPILMYVLLARISGVPPLEAHMKRSRPEAFAAYAARVSEFWPRPPRL